MPNRPWEVEEARKKMKKTMLAISALSAAVAFQASADGIVSSSVVGYNKDTPAVGDVVYRVFSFEGLSGSSATFKLGQIGVGESGFAYYNNDYIATVDEYGAQNQYYTWDPFANGGEGGWFECDEIQMIDSEAPADNVVLPLNRAIFICSAYGAELTYSGAVMAGDTALYAEGGDLTFTGNFTPAPITLGDIVVGGENFAYYNNDYIATIDAYGAQDQYYTWDPFANGGEGGWFECDEIQTVDSEAPAESVVFPANQAFIFCTAYGVTLNIPSPL